MALKHMFPPYNRYGKNHLRKAFSGLKPIDSKLIEAIREGKIPEQFYAEQAAEKIDKETVYRGSTASEKSRKK